MTEPRRIMPLPLGGEHGLPYSRGLMARALMAVGVAPDRAYRAFDRLESLGYLARSGNPRDGRGFVVRATPAGLALVDAMVASSPERVWQVLRQTAPAELARLSGSLRRLLAQFEVDAPDAGKHG